MADLTITAANVTYVAGAISKEEIVAGVAITAGQVVYKDTAASNVGKLAQSDGTSLESTVAGIALNDAAATQPVVIAKTGDMDMGTTLVVGETYVLSQTAGKIAPVADLTTGDMVTHVGIATTASNLKISIVNTLIEHV